MRHMHLVDGIPKKEIARRFGLDIKTVRRALKKDTPPLTRESSPRPRLLDPYRERIINWLKEEPKLTAKRIGRLLRPDAGSVPTRTIRKYVSGIRADLFPKEAFVLRTHLSGQTMEVDFGESFAVVAGEPRRIKFMVATLPCSNAYFAKAYPVERIECLLDGIAEAFRYFGGVTRRCVLDNTSLAVKKVLAGPDREENRVFHGFRGGFPFAADFCAPRKGWEKGSVEAGVRYVRNNNFRPRPEVKSFDELNENILAELEDDLDARRLPDGRTARQALEQEREQLRPLPAHPPEACRVFAKVVDKFGRVRVDGSHYSAPIEHAYRPVTCKLFHDRVVIAFNDKVVGEHVRSFRPGTQVLEPRHILRLLERKHRAASEATALHDWKLPDVFHELRCRLAEHVRKPDREWIGVLRLLEEHTEEDVEGAIREALERGTPRLGSVKALLRHQADAGMDTPRQALVATPEALAISVAQPDLGAYDSLTEYAS